MAIENVINTLQQQDKNNCGIYTYQNAKHLSRGQHFPMFPHDIPAMRKIQKGFKNIQNINGVFLQQSKTMCKISDKKHR